MALSKAELVEYIFAMVEKAQGKKQLKAMDIQKAVLKAHPDQPKNDVKFAISFIEIPHEEGAAKH
jgi:hypothetical protein